MIALAIVLIILLRGVLHFVDGLDDGGLDLGKGFEGGAYRVAEPDPFVGVNQACGLAPDGLTGPAFGAVKEAIDGALVSSKGCFENQVANDFGVVLLGRVGERLAEPVAENLGQGLELWARGPALGVSGLAGLEAPGVAGCERAVVGVGGRRSAARADRAVRYGKNFGVWGAST
ncbi:MAG TPA: hypothetical protein VI756_00180 [Blastocatellia bacterium]